MAMRAPWARQDAPDEIPIVAPPSVEGETAPARQAGWIETAIVGAVERAIENFMPGVSAVELRESFAKLAKFLSNNEVQKNVTGAVAVIYSLDGRIREIEKRLGIEQPEQGGRIQPVGGSLELAAPAADLSADTGRGAPEHGDTPDQPPRGGGTEA